jgi:hypothetical protein
MYSLKQDSRAEVSVAAFFSFDKSIRLIWPMSSPFQKINAGGAFWRLTGD